jgi:Ca2+-binding RTX toxin-like protein
MPSFRHSDQNTTGTQNSELIRGGHGNDTLNGAGGSDVVNGEKGDDLLIFNLSENIGEENLYDGGKGYDTFRIVLTLDQFQDLRDELSEMKAWIAENADVKNSTSMTGKDKAVNSHQHPEFETSFGLTIRNFEDVEIFIDGVGEVDPDNNAPVLADDSFTTDEDNSIVITTADLLTNDSDVDGDTLNVTAVDSQAIDSNNNVVGTVSLVGNDITFVPNADFAGTAFFNYTADDGSVVDAQTATVSIEVNAVADAPVITVVDKSGDEDTSIDLDLGVALADTDGSESLGDVTISGVPNDASLSAGVKQVNGDWIVAPTEIVGLQLQAAPNFNGEIDLEISVDSIEASNGDIANTTKNITVTVNPVNDAPVAEDDTGFSTNEDTAIVIDTADLIANDFDIDGDTLTVVGVDAVAVDGLNNPVGSVVQFGNQITFTPDANYSGEALFNYTVEDGNGGTDSASVNVDVVAVADAPVVQASDLLADEDTLIDLNLDAQLSDTDGSESLGDVTISGVPNDASLSAGIKQINGDWIVAPTEIVGLQLQAAPNFNGEIDLEISVDSVEASNGDIANTTENFTITVNPVNDAPEAEDDTGFVTNEDNSLVINTSDLLANDFDADGDTLAISSIDAAAVDSLSNTVGTVSKAGGVVTFTPDANYNGEAFFNYTVEDGNGGTDTATVSVDVLPVNDAPVANDDSGYVTDEDNSLVINTSDLLANDFDVDGDTITISSIDAAAVDSSSNTVGTVSEAGGVVTFTPDANYNGEAFFNYTVEDGNGGTDTATVSVDVLPINDAPMANDDNKSTIQSQTALIPFADLLLNDTDVDGDLLNITSVANAVNGSAILDGLGNVEFIPDSGFIGTASFEYTIEDGNGGTDTAVVTVDVAPGVPVTVADVFNIGSSSSESVPADGVLANDTDPLGGGLNATLSSEAISSQTIYSWNNGVENITLEDTTSDVAVNGDGSVDVNTSFYHGYYDFAYEANNALFSQSEDFQLKINVDSNGKIDTGTDEEDEVVNGSDSGEAIVANGANDFITANAGNDVIVGDSIGGANSFDFPENLNLALSLDLSGSMTQNNAFNTMVAAATNILNDYVDAFANNPYFQSVSFNVHINAFATDITSQSTFNDVTSVNNIVSYMNSLGGQLGGATDYADALFLTESYFTNNAVAGDINDYYFFSDGVPQVSGGGVINQSSTAADYQNNFPGLYGGIDNLDIISVGIDNGNLQTAQLDLLDDLTANNSVIDINTLFTDTGFELPFDDGSDNINGGDDNDIIFGDSIATDGLSAQLVSDLINDTKATIEANHTTLNVEGQTRGGNDVINGGDGDDIIYGQAGDDIINGGNGNDTIFGGVGSDILTGDAGADTFAFLDSDFANSASTDRITDFEDGIDLIDISDYGIADFNADVSIVDTIDGAVVSVAGTSQDILLEGIDSLDLDNSDFIL